MKHSGNFDILNVKGPLLAGVDQLLRKVTIVASAGDGVNTINGPVTSLTLSGLHGDSDLVYFIRYKIINGYNGSAYNKLLINNDSTTGHYGTHEIDGTNTSGSAYKDTNLGTIYLSNSASAQNNISFGELLIHACSGHVRPVFMSGGRNMSGTTVSTVDEWAYVWSNTADEITSLVIASSQTNGIGVGSIIELFARRDTA